MPKALQRTFIYFCSVVLTQGASFLLLPLFTHYLEPKDYGTYTFALAISSLIGVLGSTWIHNISFRFYFEARQENRTHSFFWSTVLLQTSLLTLFFIGLFLINLVLPKPIISFSILFAIVGLTLSHDFYSFIQKFVRAENLSFTYAVLEVVTSLIRVGGTFVCFSFGFKSPEAIFIVASLSVLPGIIVGVKRLYPKLLGGNWIDANAMRNILCNGFASLPFSASFWIEQSADRFVIDSMLGRVSVGIYSAGYSLADRLVGSLINSIFMMSWPDIISSFTDKGPAATRIAISRALKLYFWLTVGPTVFLMINAQTFVNILGSEYQASLNLIPIVAAAAWVSGLNVYFNRHIELYKHFGQLSGITAIGAFANVILNVVLIPDFGLQGAALATLINHIVTGLIFFLTRDRELVDIPVFDILTCATVTLLSYTMHLWLPGWYKMVGFVLVYTLGLVWIFMVLFWKPSFFLQRRNTFKSSKK